MKIVRLTESDLTRIVRRVIKEQYTTGEVSPKRATGLKDPEMMTFEQFLSKYSRDSRGGTMWKIETGFSDSNFVFTDSQNKTFRVKFPTR